MKKFSVMVMLLVSFHVLAQKAPNDSCAVSIQHGGQHFWYCDNGIFENSKVSGNKKISSEKWLSLKANLKVAEEMDALIEKSQAKVPNDSCAIGMRIGSDHYLRCDGGLYANSKTGYSQISAAEWNKKINQIPTPADSVEVEECSKDSLPSELIQKIK